MLLLPLRRFFIHSLLSHARFCWLPIGDALVVRGRALLGGGSRPRRRMRADDSQCGLRLRVLYALWISVGAALTLLGFGLFWRSPHTHTHPHTVICIPAHPHTQSHLGVGFAGIKLYIILQQMMVVTFATAALHAPHNSRSTNPRPRSPTVLPSHAQPHGMSPVTAAHNSRRVIEN